MGVGGFSSLNVTCHGPCDALERGADSIWFSGSGVGLPPGNVAT